MAASTAHRTAVEIIRKLKKAAGPKRSGLPDNYCPTAAMVLGSPANAVHTITTEMGKRLHDQTAGWVFAMVRELVESGIFEARAVGWLILAGHQPAMVEIGETEIVEFAQGLDNWAATDVYGTRVAGPAWREGRIGTRLINRWTTSDDPWFRRLAAVCTVALNVKARGGTGDPQRTLAVCKRLVDDREPMVAKGLSWALRAAIQHDRAGVEGFLDRYGDRLPALVRREVRNKLETGLKTPGKRHRS